MTTREKLDKVLAELPEVRLYEVLDFARYLHWLSLQEHEELDFWRRFGQAHLARAYGPDEPEYTEADIKATCR